MITQDQLITFKVVQEQLKNLKAEEAKLRVEICDELLKNKPTGTHTFHIDGLTVKTVKKNSVSFDNDILPHMYEQMNEEERACIVYKPNFAAAAYKRLEFTDMVDQVIITKPAMPTLQIIIEESA